MAKKDNADPSTTSGAYDVMFPVWQKMRTLLAGTSAMRAAARRYLPQHDEEKDHVYDERLRAAVLLNMTELTLNSWVGRPFSDPIQFPEQPGLEWEAFLDDVDKQSNNLHVFSRTWFKDGMAAGLSHVLVDYPIAPDLGRPRTRADDIAEQARPYWCHIPAENVIFAAAEIVNGQERLAHVRIQECITERRGFAEVEIQQIKIFEPGRTEIWRETKQKRNGRVVWAKYSESSYDLPYIPLVTFYSDRCGLMMSKPPLADLADLNIAHWQSGSDQRAVLTVARFPMLALSGGEQSPDPNQKMVVGPRKWLFTPDPSGRYYYVEHSGAAIGAGREDLHDLEEQMGQYGAAFLKRRPGSETATARALDSAEATSPLQDAVMRFEDALNRALEITADWMKTEALTAEVSKDFGPEDLNATDVDALNAARDKRDISRKAFLGELKRRAILNDEYDIEADAAELEQEANDMMGAPTATLDLDAPAAKTDALIDG